MDRFRDPWSAVTHWFGVLLAVCGGSFLFFSAALENESHLLAFVVYTLGGVVMFAGSAVYHSVKCSAEMRAFLRKIDHLCIFGFIAATYTPVCVIAMKHDHGDMILLAAWGIAIGGGMLKHFWKTQPMWVSYCMYFVAGWLVVLAAPFLPHPLSQAMPGTFGLLLGGGIFYTVGALIDAFDEITGKRYKLYGWNGHDIFHVFVLAGWGVHFYMNWLLAA